MLYLATDYSLSWRSLFFWIVFFAAYWLPTFLAFMRNIRERTTVVLLNVFGFLLIPWLLALIVAVVSARVEPKAPAPPTV